MTEKQCYGLPYKVTLKKQSHRVTSNKRIAIKITIVPLKLHKINPIVGNE